MNGDSIGKLLADISDCAGDYFEAYVIGGSALVLLGIQEMTKDVDLLFTDEQSRAEFINRALKSGFAAIDDPANVAGQSGDRSIMLLGRDATIVDCFLRRTTHFTTSPALIRRALDFLDGPGASVRIVSALDIFLLKSATGRPSDSRMAREILRHSAVDWDALLATVREQHGLGNRRAMYDVAALMSEAGLWGSAPPAFAREIFNAVQSEVAEMQNMACG